MTHHLPLTETQRRELEFLVRTDPRPYMRERAAALLHVADGMPATVVARTGLLRPRNRKTIVAWLARYRADGVLGLRIRPGRGRKPAFSPSGGEPGSPHAAGCAGA